MSAETVASALVSGWIARFGCPTTIRTEQGRQFESSVFTSLLKLLGSTSIRTTAYHPQANGLVERLHRQLKASLRAHENERWTGTLPLVLLGLGSAVKEDLHCSPAELVYGSALHLPGEFFTAKFEVVLLTFVDHIRNNMSRIKPIQTSKHSSNNIFVHPALATASHAFLRDDTIRKPLKSPYTGTHEMTKKPDKHSTLNFNGKHLTVSVDRQKTAFISSSNSTPPAPLPIPLPTPSHSETCRYGRKIKVRFNP